MWTKKIKIKDQNHLKEVVEALESMGEEVRRAYYGGTKYIWCNEKVWLFSVYSNNSDFWLDSKDVPEYEIIEKTSFKLKEVPKINITCKKCGKTVEYNEDSFCNDMFKDFVGFSGYIVNGDKVIESEDVTTICKDCIKNLINN